MLMCIGTVLIASRWSDHHSYSRVFCTLPSFARIKRPKWRPVELNDPNLRPHGKIKDWEQSILQRLSQLYYTKVILLSTEVIKFLASICAFKLRNYFKQRVQDANKQDATKRIMILYYLNKFHNFFFPNTRTTTFPDPRGCLANLRDCNLK